MGVLGGRAEMPPSASDRAFRAAVTEGPLSQFSRTQSLKMSSLVLEKICKRFATAEVLAAIDLTVEAGERIAIAGESGSGKTTLLRVIAGLEQPSAGRIRIDSLDVTTRPANRRGVGIVFQDYATYPRLTIAENLTVSLVGSTITKAEKEARLAEIVSWLELDGMLRRLPTELSGGQLQRVALGKALMARPKLLLLDEPFSQLDVRRAEQMRRLLAESHKRFGTTQIVVTHQPLDALCSFDKLAILDKGRVVQVDTPDAVRQRPKTRFAAELTSPCGLNVLPAQALAGLTTLGAGDLWDDKAQGASACFRPEAVHFCGAEPAHRDGWFTFSCRLGQVRDLGIVRLQEGQVGDHRISILCRGGVELMPGEQVVCAVQREDVLAFPA